MRIIWSNVANEDKMKHSLDGLSSSIETNSCTNGFMSNKSSH